MEALKELIPRARAGRLRSSEMTDGTITVTSLGDLGVETVHGVIYPPQVALVGFGKILEQPWAENGMLGIRPVVSATLAGDHRATDGRRGAQFLDALATSLQRAGSAMNAQELRDTILKLLAHAAPEADVATIAGDEPLQRALDLDSFDFLNFLVALRDELGVTIEESDYGTLRTLDDLMRFLEPRVGT